MTFSDKALASEVKFCVESVAEEMATLTWLSLTQYPTPYPLGATGPNENQSKLGWETFDVDNNQVPLLPYMGWLKKSRPGLSANSCTKTVSARRWRSTPSPFPASVPSLTCVSAAARRYLDSVWPASEEAVEREAPKALLTNAFISVEAERMVSVRPWKNLPVEQDS